MERRSSLLPVVFSIVRARRAVSALLAAMLVASLLVAGTALSAASARATTGTPPWWSGTCDVNNDPGSYALGASFDGVQACGPGPTQGGSDHLVRFFSGAWGEYEWECVELVMRYMYLVFGIAPYSANGNTVVSGYRGSVLAKETDPAHDGLPSVGDVLSFAGTKSNPNGHTSIVTAVTSSSLTTIEENAALNGVGTVPVSNGVVGGGVTGWLHNPNAGGPTSPTGIVPQSGVIPTGARHFAYFVAADGTLRDEHWTGTAWQQDNFGVAVKANTSPSAYLAPNGTHFVYFVASDGTLRDEHWTGTAWQQDNFGVAVKAYTSPSAYVGFNGTHFVYFVASDGTLRDEHWTGTAWQQDNFGVAVKANTGPSAYLAPNGTHFVYFVASDGTLRDEHWTGTAWQQDNFGVAVKANTNPSAYLGAYGTHFVYFVASDGTLRIEHWTGTAWQQDNFGAAVKWGSSPSAYLA